MNILDFLGALAVKLTLSLLTIITAISGTLFAPPTPDDPASAVPLVVATSKKQAATVPEAVPATAKPTAIPDPAPQATPPPPPLPPEKPTAQAATSTLPGTLLNELARSAIVNILCTTKTGGSLYPITASGVVIDPRGVILTNAHVGQYYLLRDYGSKDYIDCVIRTGSPAYPRYRASLLYISSEWVRENANQITSQTPLGTGENDFAFLVIDRSTNEANALPSSFPYLPVDLTEDSLKLGAQTLTAAYPAGFLGGISVQRELYLSSAFTTLMNLYSFTGSTVDVISVGGSIVAQRGSSGGGVVDMFGKLLGIVSTSSDATDTSGRDLRAITLGHINRSLLLHEGYGLLELLSGDLASKSGAFGVAIAPTLSRLLEIEIEKPNQ